MFLRLAQMLNAQPQAVEAEFGTLGDVLPVFPDTTLAMTPIPRRSQAFIQAQELAATQEQLAMTREQLSTAQAELAKAHQTILNMVMALTLMRTPAQ